MSNTIHHNLGILGFGSLISYPGDEISENELARVSCKTPFKVEFARISSSRGNAPTLIPVPEDFQGKKVNAEIIVLKEEVSLTEAKNMLYRRESDTKEHEVYSPSDNPGPKAVLIDEENNLCGVEKVIYTWFKLQDDAYELTPERLANYAIDSILSHAGAKGKDGIRYLLDAKENGIETELSPDYEKALLEKNHANNLEEVIEELDLKRKSSKNKSK